MLSSIIKLIPTLKQGERFLLGIDGLSRSGKTTLVKCVSEKLQEKDIPFSIFHIDDHIVERKKRYDTGHAEWFEYYYLQWDIDWLKNDFFRLLKTDEELMLPFYKSETDCHETKYVTLPETGVIIVEGVFLQRKEWKQYFDSVVYLDCPREKRFSRETNKTQQNLKKFQKRYWKAEEHYMQTESPATAANLILHV